MIDTQKRLAIFISGMYGGGAARAMIKLAGGITERGYAVDLVMARAEGPFLAEVPETVRVVDLKARRVLTSLPALIQYLRRERPLAMLSALAYVNIVAIWATRLVGHSIPLVVSERNTLSHSIQHKKARRMRLIPRLIRHFYPWANGIIAVSKGVADDLAEVTGIPRQRIQVIYNPIVTPELQAKVGMPLDHPWFKPGQPPVLLAAGRLHPQKDFPSLIQAMAKVRATRSARLLILGEGAERPRLEALVRQLGLEQVIGLPGFVVNPYPYMVRAALFVLSSKWEGLPGVLIEALYCGTPIVATDCPSGPSEILMGGRYGHLVPVGDTTALARAIETTLAGQRPTRSPEACLHYELETVVDQYLNILLGGS